MPLPKQISRAEPRPVQGDVIPPEVLDLVRFMCATWSEIDQFVYQHCDGDALTHYPVVQGTSNQIRLQRIGEQPHDLKNVGKAAEWLQRYNANITGAGAAKPQDNAGSTTEQK